jgi:hypothetical protein
MWTRATVRCADMTGKPLRILVHFLQCVRQSFWAAYTANAGRDRQDRGCQAGSLHTQEAVCLSRHDHQGTHKRGSAQLSDVPMVENPLTVKSWAAYTANTGPDRQDRGCQAGPQADMDIPR